MASNVTRTNTLLSRMSAMQKRIAAKVEIGLMAVGHKLLEESQKLVPQDTVALKDSGRVSKIGTLFQTVVIVGYGGKDFQARFSAKWNEWHQPHEYAVYVHQGMEPPHTYTVGQENFLGEPLVTKLPEMRQVLETILKGTGVTVVSISQNPP